ncbi:TIGR04104 family putative zinc finger protein [Evansella tamaricis]
MRKCPKCNHSFSWYMVLKSFWINEMYCENCDAKVTITPLSRILVILSTMALFYTFSLFLTPFDNFTISIIVGLFVTLIWIFITTFFIKYKTIKTEKV